MLLILWETDAVTVSEITRKLLLETSTVTPLLKRMEVLGLLARGRSVEDERKVIVKLTRQGIELKARAALICQPFVAGLLSAQMDLEALSSLRDQLPSALIGHLSAKSA